MDVVVYVTVASVHGRHVHRANIVWVAESLGKAHVHEVEVVRHESPLRKLETIRVFQDGTCQSIFHAVHLILAILLGTVAATLLDERTSNTRGGCSCTSRG